MYKYIWLSHPLNEKTSVYGGGKGLIIEQTKSIVKGDSCNTATWHLPNHTGTHVDTPRHFFGTGKTIDEYDPRSWVFERICVVSVFLGNTASLIKPKHVVPFLYGEPDLILIRTGMGKYRGEKKYWESNPGLSAGLGREIRTCCPYVRAVGVDFISISSWENRIEGRKAHREFLNPAGEGAPLILIEDMNLLTLDSNFRINRVFVLPLIVENADGAPCSVLAEVEVND